MAKQSSKHYAVGPDFCRMFMKDMAHLHLLSLLLTADDARAEECFVRGLEDSWKSGRVFKEWAQSWARRTIIQNAIVAVKPEPAGGNASSRRQHRTSTAAARMRPEFAAILELPDLERFVFVMSVLEHYSDQECSLLLGSTRDEVVASRTRALQQIGRAGELRKATTVNLNEQTVQGAELTAQSTMTLRLAASI